MIKVYKEAVSAGYAFFYRISKIWETAIAPDHVFQKSVRGSGDQLYVSIIQDLPSPNSRCFT
jgi:hypothetical protein